ncbi:GT4 family glycosyltransferase PelF [Methylobacterium durans]|uniref:GT4 family glycosyltransferase PelF n=1 Tax=Methylobacterium durans TaxID=2202825 RepID=UPI002AFE2E70|nr:GT4 family glycosyltransferase PelF [Methylobacterium durans]MEA1832373.1 GT4 family glycosyltransferase PelF [Methylobacterium durans]
MRFLSSAPKREPEADICLVVEGCYPYVRGGVSTWVDWLIRGNPDLTFAIVAIVADRGPREIRYTLPENVVAFSDLHLHTDFRSQPWQESARTSETEEILAEQLIALVRGGGVDAFDRLVRLVNDPESGLTHASLMASPLSWRVTCQMYERLMPHASFLHFFWAWRALFGGLFAVLKAPLPRARVYHTISTGYAGLVAARAALETGRPALITEHGIYTNERRVEVLMAEWICDTVDKGISLTDERVDLRDIWMQIFDAHALICYQACSRIITLYEDNQRLQKALGAAPSRLAVIANGIDVESYAALPVAGPDDPPTMALIGRVVPIKDVKSYIEAAAILRQRIPGLQALVMGPTDEDAAYFEECLDLVRDLDLGDTVVFTGSIKLVEHLSRVHVVVLTSLSEAQPLVILEAGAAGIPCVATDVGSCREILEGRSTEAPRLGAGGAVTPLVSPRETAAAVEQLLRDERLRREQGEALRVRVRRYYASEDALSAYRDTYAHYLSPARAEATASGS